MLVKPTIVHRHPYRVPLIYHKEIERQIEEMKEQGIISPTRSPYNAPIVPAKKKTGYITLCLDFSALNEVIMEDRYPLP